VEPLAHHAQEHATALDADRDEISIYLATQLAQSGAKQRGVGEVEKIEAVVDAVHWCEGCRKTRVIESNRNCFRVAAACVRLVGECIRAHAQLYDEVGGR
jgi:hypothetical protein